jgi:hypothetical protein
MNIRSVPTLRLWNGSQFVETIVGMPPKSDLIAKADSLVNG